MYNFHLLRSKLSPLRPVVQGCRYNNHISTLRVNRAHECLFALENMHRNMSKSAGLSISNVKSEFPRLSPASLFMALLVTDALLLSNTLNILERVSKYDARVLSLKSVFE